jgi:hypothetical protein
MVRRSPSFEAGWQEANQLNPIIIPPPARADDFKNDRLLYVVFIKAMIGKF